MSASLFFNLSFDLVGISLILFVIWFFVNFNNPAAAFKWFSLSILALLASVIILSYGTTKLSRVRSSLPTQNQTEIANLKQEISTLKGTKSSHPTSNSSNFSGSQKTASSKVPSRIVNSKDNQIVKDAASKHEQHIELVAKVTNSDQPLMVRGVHSSQIYKVSGHHSTFNVGEFVIIKGTATSVNGDVINLSATSSKKQTST